MWNASRAKGWSLARRWAAIAAVGLLLPNLAAAVDVQIATFMDSPDPAVRGGNISYTITASNTDADTANNVVVSFGLLANTVFVSAADAAVPGACVHNGGSPGAVTCSYATLLGTLAIPAGPVRTIVVVLRTTGTTVTTLNTTATITTSDVDSNLGNNSLGQNTTVNDGADLTATLVGTPDPSLGGGNVAWTVSGSNLGPNTSGLVTFGSTLPAVLSYLSASGSGWSCSPVGQQLTCSRAAVAPGAYPDLQINTRITGVASGTVTLSGNIGSTVGDPDPSNNSPVASVTVSPGTDLSVTQDVPVPSPAITGEPVSFVLRPGNLGPYPATAGARVSFPLPVGFVVTSASGSTGWSCSFSGAPATVICDFAGSLASGASGALTIVATTPILTVPTAYNGITATIEPGSGGPADPVTSNNTAARNLTVAPDGVDLRVTKNKSPAFVALGANITSSIVVINTGPRTAASGSITVVDALDPAREQFVSFSGSNWVCASVPPNVNCTYNTTLGIASSSPLTIITQALAAGTATNDATVSYSGVPGDYNPANDSISASVTVTATNNSPDLLVGVSAATAGGALTRVEVDETQITYTATLTNKVTGVASNAQDVLLTLSIPGRRTTTDVVVTGQVLTNTSGTSNAVFSCSGTGSGSTGGISCSQTAGTQLSPGDGVTFTVTADRPLNDGSFMATANANAAVQGDPTPSDNTATVAVTIDPIADVEVVSKVLAINPVLAGTNATYTLTLRNNGPSSAANVALADVFTIPGGDSGFTFISATASDSGSCSGLTANTPYSAGTPTLNCSWAAALGSGATRTVTVIVRPNWQAGVAARTLDNTATVSTSTPEDSVGGQGTAANSRSLTLNINPAQVDLLINNTDSPDPLGHDPVTTANNDVTYTVVTTNNGPSLASGTGFSFVMTPPAGKTISLRGDGAAAGVAAANPSGTIPGSLCDQLGSAVTGPAILTVTCAHPAPAQLANTASVTRRLVFRVDSAPNTGGDVYNTSATVIVNETDTNLSNNSELEGTTVRVRSDISIVKTPSINPVQLRQPFDWSIVVANAGPGDSQTTGLTDTLPSGMAFGASAPSWTLSSGGSGSCSVASQTLTCAFGLVPAGASATVTIPGVRMTSYPAGGTTQNCATATTSEVDPFSVNNLSVCATLTVQRSSLAGTVFQDRDRAGANAGTPQAAAAEPRIASVTVTLTGTDAYGNAVSQTTTTNASGAFSFNNLSPADASGYVLTQTQPAAFVNGPDNPPAPAASGSYSRGGTSGSSSWDAIALASNTAGTSYNFPEVLRPSLAGFVYIDINANNSRDVGTDVAIVTATVRLLDAATGSVVQITTTDGSGAYAFSNLDPLTVYTLEQPLPTAPAGLANGPVNPGLINGAACASGCTAQPDTPAAGTDRIAAIDLGAGSDGTLFNFGERPVTSVSGLVFIDSNRDAAMGAGETGRLAGVTMRLVQGADCTSGTLMQSVTTSADGSYAFLDVPAFQNYRVCQTQPPGYATGSANGTVGSNAITITNLATSGAANNNFGEILGSIAGEVYADQSPATPANTNNGVRDAGEAGIGGVTVTLTGRDITGAAVNRTATTLASGSYVFEALLQSDASGYSLSEGAVPLSAGSFNDGIDSLGSAGGSNTVNDVLSAIVLGAGVQATGYNFGELPIAAISGIVYIDRNRNNAPDATPTDGRLGGVTLSLYAGGSCSGAALASTVSDASGNYAFMAVSTGLTYTVCQTQPAGYADGGVNPGSSASSSATDAITISNLPASGSAGNHFGERVGSIAGTVYLDANNDGTRQGAEAGVLDVRLTLTGTDVNGTTVNRSTTTDAAGHYIFADLLAAGPGGYQVTEQAAQPVVGTVTTLNGRTSAGTIAGSTSGSATPVATTPSAVSNIALPAGGDSVGNRFGEILPVGLSGTVFIDLNNNGAQNLPADTGLANVTIVITGTDDTGAAVTRTLSTAADGSFGVADLRPGTYTLTEPEQPAGTSNGQTVAGTAGGSATARAITPSAIGGIVLTTPGMQSSANRFAEIPNSSAISGRVWLDLDRNDLMAASETGIAGITLQLSGTDSAGQSVTRSTVTDATGHYSFDSLSPGTYTVTEPTQPAGTLNGITLPGTAGGTATPVGTTPSAISGITLAVGQTAINNHFGEHATSPDLRVSKRHTDAVLTVGKPATYTLTVRNAGETASSGAYTVEDRLPVGLTLAATPSGTGWVCAGAAGAASFSCSSSTVILASAASGDAITVVAEVGAAAAAAASPVNNVVLVDGGGEIDIHRPTPAERDAFFNHPAALPVCTPAVVHNACRDPAPVQLAASLSGTAWSDIGSTPRVLEAGDRRLPGWLVEVVDVASNTVVGSAITTADGSYRVINLIPGIAYGVRFRDPQSRVIFGYPVNGETAPGSSGASCANGLPAVGTASSCVGTGANPHLTVVLAPGQDLSQQSLPVDPSGVVYDSGLRQPVPGAIVTLEPVGSCSGWNPATDLVGATLGGYTINGHAVAMTVGNDGFYQFLFAPSAPAMCQFSLTVSPPAGYTSPSVAIPPNAGPLLPPGGAGTVYAVQPQASAPTAAPGPATAYYLLVSSGSAGADIVHNHLPIDPALPAGINLSKSGDKALVELGDTVRYTVTATFSAGAAPRQITVVDRIPAGFSFVRGSATVNDVRMADPTGGVGPTLAFQLGAMPASQQLVLRYRLRVGVGAQQGEAINRAQAHACGVPEGCVDPAFNPIPGSVPTSEARFSVRVQGGVFTAEACVLGKVFVDCNGNHVQDREELGIPGVRLVLSDGSHLISDSEGKYSLCGLPPKSHVLKLDGLTLPRGSRLTISSNRNLGDPSSLWLDLKTGELHRADFVEGSCSNSVLEQVKARRAQGEVRAPETEKKGAPALRFDSKAHGLDTQRSPQQGTDGANQHAPKPRAVKPGSHGSAPSGPAPSGSTPSGPASDESNEPTPSLPMNRPPPRGRDPGTAPDAPAPAPASATTGAANGPR